MPIRPYLLAETNWKHLKDARFDLAILPWGATEAHNYHLPYATDNIQVDAIAAESARLAWEQGAKVIVLPCIPFGVNTGQTDIYLDINMRPSTQMAVLRDILEVLQRQGLKRFLLLNGHGGNNFKSMLRELGLDFPDMLLCFSNWFQAMDKTLYFDEMGDHADEMETSLMLHLRPDLILPKTEWGDGSEKKHQIQGFREKWAWTERPWSTISADTGTGSPHEASAEKGAAFLEDLCQKMGDFLYDLATRPLNEFYQ